MRRLAAMVAGLAAVLTLVAEPALPAAAGTNGQQLAFVPSCTASWVYIQGYNQDYQWTRQWFFTPPASPGAGHCHAPVQYDWGMWWKGRVQVDGYWGRYGEYRSTVFVQVPAQSQNDSDWVTVGVPG
jgi:hypothetical protein